MSTSICNSFTLSEQTRVKIKITQQSTCGISIEDVSDDCYVPPLRYGFHPEINPELYELPQGQYRRSWGYFVNVIFPNQYDATLDVCHQIQQSQTLVFEDGSNPLSAKDYTLSKDQWYTVYRFFIFKKSVLEEMVDKYADRVWIVQEEVDGAVSLFKGTVVDGVPIYEAIENISEVVAIYENSNPTQVTGAQVKEEFVSTCYLTNCYNSLNEMILEAILNPCLTPGAKSPRSLFGVRSQNCESINNNPLSEKRELLFMILSTIKIYVENCDFCKAQKLIQEIMGVNTNCNQFYFLCGDIPNYNKISKGCGCK